MIMLVKVILFPVYFRNLLPPVTAYVPLKLTAAFGFHPYTSLQHFKDELPSNQPRGSRDHALHRTTPLRALLVEGLSVNTFHRGGGAQQHHLPGVGVRGRDIALPAAHSISCEGTSCTKTTHSLPMAAVQDLPNDIVYLSFPSAEQRALLYLPPPQLPDGVSGDQLSVFLSKLRGIPLFIQGPFDIRTNKTLTLTVATQAFPFWSGSVSAIGSLVTMLQRLWMQIFLKPFQVLGPTPPLRPYSDTLTTPSPSETSTTAPMTPSPIRLGPAPG